MTEPEHTCSWPEVVIGRNDEEGVLKRGMRVLVPCTCGRTPLDGFGSELARADEAEKALMRSITDRDVPLFHWSPTARRKQILRYGLRPAMRVTTHPDPEVRRWPNICFADTPAWAWALSGAQRSAPSGSWDLWQTWANRLTEPMASVDSSDYGGIHEVRTEHRVYKRDLWFVGTRIKPAKNPPREGSQ